MSQHTLLQLKMLVQASRTRPQVVICWQRLTLIPCGRQRRQYDVQTRRGQATKATSSVPLLLSNRLTHLRGSRLSRANRSGLTPKQACKLHLRISQRHSLGLVCLTNQSKTFSNCLRQRRRLLLGLTSSRHQSLTTPHLSCPHHHMQFRQIRQLRQLRQLSLLQWQQKGTSAIDWFSLQLAPVTVSSSMMERIL